MVDGADGGWASRAAEDCLSCGDAEVQSVLSLSPRHLRRFVIVPRCVHVLRLVISPYNKPLYDVSYRGNWRGERDLNSRGLAPYGISSAAH